MPDPRNDCTDISITFEKDDQRRYNFAQISDVTFSHTDGSVFIYVNENKDTNPSFLNIIEGADDLSDLRSVRDMGITAFFKSAASPEDVRLLYKNDQNAEITKLPESDILREVNRTFLGNTAVNLTVNGVNITYDNIDEIKAHFSALPDYASEEGQAIKSSIDYEAVEQASHQNTEAIFETLKALNGYRYLEIEQRIKGNIAADVQHYDTFEQLSNFGNYEELLNGYLGLIEPAQPQRNQDAPKAGQDGTPNAGELEKELDPKNIEDNIKQPVPGIGPGL